MLKKNLDGIPFYEFELFQKFRGGLRHAVFTRHSDISSPLIIQKIFKTDAYPIAFKNQLHGTKIVNVIPAKASIYEGDAFITKFSNLTLVIRIADCASIILYDPKKRIIANIHAGWRGLAQKIIHKTIDRMGKRFGTKSKNLLAAISPMIGPCCCRFSDPYKELPRFMHQYIAEENMVDLWATVESHLHECGVLPKHIENPRVCTSCHPEDFFSFRREGSCRNKMGRFATAIMLI